ncbi:PHB depolymerase family esterase [Sulfitobacter sp. S190]|uniref:alpha/beta hydrolase family esterase n=1 Tax=Sulfitobacter sp. S190 TaxID=2867022 RepID=UPI0021A79FBB|nr:prolyl oligopeptidase family serine peptidase [Sulfitobacter sp. S190]UWR22070.1 prolyl oligopeptidase family serine peptidase [Sulfitobacter sp. S190]
MRLASLIAVLASVFAAPVVACGQDTDCRVGDRIYRISLPEGHNAGDPIGAVLWSHGYRGSAEGVMRNGSLRKMVHDQGLALIGMQGIDGSWNLPNGPGTMDSTGAEEFAYYDAVIADAVARFNIDADHLVASGFSAGGMMVWNLACARPETFAGFVPISGTYWLKPPETCAMPVASIVHIHGDDDSTVPLDGRRIGETKQGEVSEALASYATHGKFAEPAKDTTAMLRCEERSNATGAILDFCLFEGGHSFRTEYLGHGIDRLRAAGQL